MTSKLGDKERELIEDAGWLNAALVIEVQGNDKDLVKTALTQNVERIKKEKDTHLYDSQISKIEELKENWFSAHVEIFLLTKDFGTLTRLSLFYAPSVVEILDPDKIELDIGDAQNLLVDISGIVTRLTHTIYEQKGALARAQSEK